MGLRLIAALLPHDYREQVLGDLTEGGYRWQDALSMLPRIWWSHLRRSVAGPVPNYSENEDTIRVRIEQLRSARMWAFAVQVGALAGFVGVRAWDASPAGAYAAAALIGIAALLLVRTTGFPDDSPPALLRGDDARGRYRVELNRQMGTTLALGILPILLLAPLKQAAWFPATQTGKAIWTLVVFTPVWLGTVASILWRLRRLRQELRRLAVKS